MYDEMRVLSFDLRARSIYCLIQPSALFHLAAQPLTFRSPQRLTRLQLQRKSRSTYTANKLLFNFFHQIIATLRLLGRTGQQPFLAAFSNASRSADKTSLVRVVSQNTGKTLMSGRTTSGSSPVFGLRLAVAIHFRSGRVSGL